MHRQLQLVDVRWLDVSPRRAGRRAAIGAWLMLRRPVLGSKEAAANSHHVIGALVLTTTAIAAAEVTRSLRVLNCPWGLALLSDLFLGSAAAAAQTASAIAGLALLLLSLPRGPIRHRYGGWNAQIV
ncbi:MAG: hypothetical protein GEV13_33415 [Rhodospirillales bacterium]|nr:hypothetical protein [Rhodospirillales bacterium]